MGVSKDVAVSLDRQSLSCSWTTLGASCHKITLGPSASRSPQEQATAFRTSRAWQVQLPAPSQIEFTIVNEIMERLHLHALATQKLYGVAFGASRA